MRGSKRVCANCGAVQYHEPVSYDRMYGSTYAWVPKVGRCKGNKVASRGKIHSIYGILQNQALQKPEYFFIRV